ncbi:ankyrin repeat domain-containing protein, chloroplastic isoform X2 [Neltuma alba]|uniref:ankyrin repeat domain-containing protein, chloroplastic isoform X2 n=1 Tax=Neltuma alba TaxID=207710 RepID=UPI0010A2B874|nr:ankyrin repeat domain-containing protein, chloroplastic-like isoform X2 [Prosopis alba]
MSPSSSSLLNPQAYKILYPLPIFPSSASQPNFCSFRIVKFPRKLPSPRLAFQSSDEAPVDDLEEHVIGDCVVFEDGIFEDPVLHENLSIDDSGSENSKPKSKKNVPEIAPENLVPDRWREAQAEINITKKERRKIAQEIEFNSRVEKKKQGMIPLRHMNLEGYKAYKEAKLAQLKPLVLDSPSSFPVKEEVPAGREFGVTNESASERVKPKNPRWAVYGRGLEDVSEFFNSEMYDPTKKNTEGRRKLFTKEEKALLNKRIPNLAAATSEKWLPLHTLAASGEFYLVDSLLKHNVDINAVDKDGLTALHKAIIGKKQAITNYLLRNSANPFILDKEGATLMHYAVQTASSQTIKILLLYNVDINLQDNDGWTPLHVAVQARRTDVVRLLLIKGADKTIKNKDGLTPLDLCLHSGQDLRTYELIKLLKQLPRR